MPATARRSSRCGSPAHVTRAIARKGGGILSTVRAVREATEESLVAASLPRLDALLAEGVTTIEIKSGYGLDQAAEERMLRAARALGRRRAVGVVTSYLAAHAIPPDFAGDAEGYIDWICREGLPAAAAAGLVDAVDAFCETVAFTRSRRRGCSMPQGRLGYR